MAPQRRPRAGTGTGTGTGTGRRNGREPAAPVGLLLPPFVPFFPFFPFVPLFPSPSPCPFRSPSGDEP